MELADLCEGSVIRSADGRAYHVLRNDGIRATLVRAQNITAPSSEWLWRGIALPNIEVLTPGQVVVHRGSRRRYIIVSQGKVHATGVEALETTYAMHWTLLAVPCAIENSSV